MYSMHTSCNYCDVMSYPWSQRSAIFDLPEVSPVDGDTKNEWSVQSSLGTQSVDNSREQMLSHKVSSADSTK